ncbi:uncharacterized protein LY89DRAFT_719968 [Mollisia scopiformis]|uniref:Uncharacterized protein n=1 Tax=Mollisia scopiformis TaxID=149040 RepID=A0A194X5R0_MOLSC|nr:uncharacterized protein LY89DRAFT_719968 [Mollisia scopiformis]KUJ15414.1 hypothetical protein LY89DRAFT_719968 [Mollisia scopiformis]
MSFLSESSSGRGDAGLIIRDIKARLGHLSTSAFYTAGIGAAFLALGFNTYREDGKFLHHVEAARSLFALSTLFGLLTGLGCGFTANVLPTEAGTLVPKAFPWAYRVWFCLLSVAGALFLAGLCIWVGAEKGTSDYSWVTVAVVLICTFLFILMLITLSWPDIENWGSTPVPMFSPSLLIPRTRASLTREEVQGSLE